MPGSPFLMSQLHQQFLARGLQPAPTLHTGHPNDPATPCFASPILPGYFGQSPRNTLSTKALCLQLQDHRPLLYISPSAHTEAQVNSFWDSFRKCPKEEPTEDHCLQLPLQPNNVCANPLSHAKHQFLQHDGVDNTGPSLSHPLLLSTHHSLPFL